MRLSAPLLWPLRRLAAAGLLLGAAPALAAGRLGGGGAPDISWLRILSALIFCLLLAAAAIFLIRKHGGRVPIPALLGRMELRQRAIQVVETRRLSHNADICLLRYGGCEYLILLPTGGARVLEKKPIAADGGEAGR